MLTQNPLRVAEAATGCGVWESGFGFGFTNATSLCLDGQNPNTRTLQQRKYLSGLNCHSEKQCPIQSRHNAVCQEQTDGQ